LVTLIVPDAIENVDGCLCPRCSSLPSYCRDEILYCARGEEVTVRSGLKVVSALDVLYTRNKTLRSFSSKLIQDIPCFFWDQTILNLFVQARMREARSKLMVHKYNMYKAA
jgi:hypothetical protein